MRVPKHLTVTMGIKRNGHELRRIVVVSLGAKLQVAILSQNCKSE